MIWLDIWSSAVPLTQMKTMKTFAAKKSLVE